MWFLTQQGFYESVGDYNKNDYAAEFAVFFNKVLFIGGVMLVRAIIAFCALPGVVAFLVPFVLMRSANLSVRLPFGLVLIALGTVALMWCVRDFYVSGKGTLAPWSPPKTLVTIGLYRYSRNPMYVAVALILLGWTLSFLSVTLLIYALCVIIAFYFRVVFGEEPWLARTHGYGWQDYKRRVRRWF